MIGIHIEKGIPMPPPHLPAVPNACKWCNRRERQGGYKTCERCRASVRAAYEERKVQGMCGWGTSCPNRAAAGHSMCQAHLARSSKKIRELLNGRVAQGLCRRCGKRSIVGTKTYCLICYSNCGGRNGGPTCNPLPIPIRKAIRKFWREDRIAQRRESVRQAISLIRDERLREIVSLRQGLVDGVDHSLESVGQKYGLTRERIRQIEAKAYGLLEELGVSISSIRRVGKSDRNRPPVLNKRKMGPLEAKKEKARRLLQEAVAAGRIAKQPCEGCGATDNVQAHHDDYDKPLNVRWVCPPHHAGAHSKTVRFEKKKRYVFPAWLERVKHSHADIYDAPRILRILKHRQLYQDEVAEATGLKRSVLLKIIRGEIVSDEELLIMLRYVESLNEKAA